jgi:N-acetylglucosamine-6-sulfatase
LDTAGTTADPTADTTAGPTADSLPTPGTAGDPLGRPAQAGERPSIVVFLMDDMRYDDMAASMPTVMARIVGRGTEFVSNYCATPLCAPSRAMLLRGQYPHHTGVIGNDDPHGGRAMKRIDDETIGVWLQRAGYHTTFIGKYINGYADLDAGYRRTYVPPGWNTWRASCDRTYHYTDTVINHNGSISNPQGEYTTGLYGDYALEALEARLDAARPFYLQVNFVAPHSGPPRNPGDDPDWGKLAMTYVPPRWRGTYAGPTRPDNPAFDEADVSDKPCLRRPRLTAERKAFIDAATQHRRDSLFAADAQIRRILAAVEAAGRLRSTAIIFTSDNGYLSGEHRIHRGKASHYQPASHVPLVIRAPGFPARREPGLCGIQDLAPTMLEMANALTGPGAVSRGGVKLDGRRLQRVVDDADDRRPAVPLEVTDGGGKLVIRGCVSADNWKYVELAKGAKCVELYDLDKDPYELNNLAEAEDMRPRRAQMRALTRALGVPS